MTDKKEKGALEAVADETLISDVGLPAFDASVSEVQVCHYHTRLNPPRKVVQVSDKPSKVQESPLDARSPQEVLEYHGMYRDPSIYKTEPQKIYMDVASFDGLQSIMNQKIEAERKFASLPVEIRSKFDHSIVKFTNAVTSPGFDVRTLLTGAELEAFDNYHKEEKAKEEYAKYLASDEYKFQLEQQKLRAEFEEQQFENWKKTRG